MKVAILCDLHLPKFKTSMQYEILDWAVDKIDCENVDLIIVAGDMTAFGEKDAFYHCLNKLKKFPTAFLLGNSDVRDVLTKEEYLNNYSKSILVENTDCTLYCLNEATTHLSEENRNFLKNINSGAFIITHHNLEAFDSESRDFLLKIMTDKSVTFIHGHKHRDMLHKLAKSTCIGLRGLDPDKVFGLPSISFFEFVNNSYTNYDVYYDLRFENPSDFRDYIGMSCYDISGDLEYAVNNNIKNIEIRLRTIPDDLDDVIEKVRKWRSQGGRYLSVHMPDLKESDGSVIGIDTWNKASRMALGLNADALTIHVPKASFTDMLPSSKLWREFSNIMFETISLFDVNVKVGIENLHLTSGMKNDENRIFGCIPEECITWINELNNRFSFDRVGAVFDIGHASNNGILASIYTRSSWYELIGKKTVHYHIHQVIKGEKGLLNHKAIDNWYGMNISYVSFLMAWQKNHLNHAPMFLEMSIPENVDKSIKAFDVFAESLKK